MNTIEDYSLQEYDDIMAVNVRAVFLASQAAARHMQAGSRIITIGSNMADRVTGSHGALYAMSKSALIGLNKGIARDLGAKGITANLVQPGPIDTDMNPATSDHAAACPQPYGHINSMAPRHRSAGLVAYLASEESGFHDRRRPYHGWRVQCIMPGGFRKSTITCINAVYATHRLR